MGAQLGASGSEPGGWELPRFDSVVSYCFLVVRVTAPLQSRTSLSPSKPVRPHRKTLVGHYCTDSKRKLNTEKMRNLRNSLFFFANHKCNKIDKCPSFVFIILLLKNIYKQIGKETKSREASND